MRGFSLLLYRLVLHTALPLAAPFLWVADRRTGKRRPPLKMRLGLGLPPVPRGGVLVHAVSVGEVTVARALLSELRRRAPHVPLLLSATTATGLQLASGAQVADATLPFPLDLPAPTRRFLAATQPRLLVLVETELWPEMLAACREAGIPVVLVNARISDRSFPRYQLFAPLLRPLLAPLTVALAQTEGDAARLVALGVPQEKVRVTGNIKFDVKPARPLAEDLKARLCQLASGRAVLVAGSTMPGEEKQVLSAWMKLPDRPFLILAPRHPERAQEVLELCRQLGLAAVRRSPLPAANATADVVVLDTVGELAALYQLATIAFVGGSLVPTGGHNPIEPARFAVPVVSGPHVRNFAAVYRELEVNGGVKLVHNARELQETLTNLLAHPEQAQAIGRNAQAVLAKHAGATAKTVEALLPFLP
ncbi:3-deoxy-D-manno-octulosonic acid transferase [bacterium HR09]|nr:3-deoxy-D-manno-octulosonic acid transferase [bacterium HR09]